MATPSPTYTVPVTYRRVRTKRRERPSSPRAVPAANRPQRVRDEAEQREQSPEDGDLDGRVRRFKIDERGRKAKKDSAVFGFRTFTTIP